MAQYLPVVVLAVLGTLFAAISLLASKIMAPSSPTIEKYAPYECGIVPGREPPERFPVRFYLVAMLFVIFDIEIVFLYPWAVAHGSLGVFGLVSVLIFSALVFESFVYLLSQGALDWGPLQVSQRQQAQSAHRTTDTTIRRVGLVGRYIEVVDEEDLENEEETNEQETEEIRDAEDKDELQDKKPVEAPWV